MADAQDTHSRWFRFRLRSLLVMTTAAAILSWGYWIGWPWWLAYREQVRFEAAVRSIHIGMTPAEADAAIDRQQGRHSVIIPSGLVNDHVILRQYTLQRGTYFLLFKTRRGDSNFASDCPVTSFEAFRFPPIPTDYQPSTPHARKVLPDNWHPRPSPAELPTVAFWIDAMEVLTGDRTNHYGLEFERFFADPASD